MITYIGKFLGKLGRFETRHVYVTIFLVLAFSAFNIVGITQIEFESDFSAMDPEQLEIVQLNKEVDEKFRSGEATIILIEIDPHSELRDPMLDVRDPRMIAFLKNLDENLRANAKVEEVFSAGMIYSEVPESLADSKEFLRNIPGQERFFSNDYSFTYVSVFTDAGFDEEKIREINDLIDQIIQDSSPPGGVTITVTGDSPLIALMFNFLINDSFNTLVYATIFILFLLFFLTRAIKKSFVIMIPLLFGLMWTAGTLGWAGVPITIATAGMSAILLGLGVEYSIFLFSRYEEERTAGLNVNEALVKALSTTGAATTSSGLTTVIGFSGLTLSVFPMLADLGFSLAVGIAYALISTMSILPLAIIVCTKTTGKIIKKKKGKVNGTMNVINAFFNSYGRFVAKRPIVMIGFALGATAVLFVGAGMISNQDIDFDTVLPEGLEELEAYNTLFGDRAGDDTESIDLFFEVLPSEIGSNEPMDVRDPRVLRYIDVISQKVEEVEHFESVSSLSMFVREANQGMLPATLSESKNILADHNIGSFVTEDYSGTVMNVDFSFNENTDEQEIIRQMYEILETTQKPAGVEVVAVGGLVVNFELDQELNPDTARTSIFAFIGIIVLLLILSRSIKYTILPLMTVVFAIFWTLGFLGFFGVPFNSITSSVLTMTIGIGIDFGLQLSMRFRQELEKRDKRDAMRETLKNVLYPMSITVVAAVIGFQTMQLGNLKLMGDLGVSMSFSILSSMLVAVTLVAGLIVVFERKKNGKRKILS